MGKPKAAIWHELFALGLTKPVVRHHLRLTQHQLARVWDWPAETLTIPQVLRLHELVATRLTIRELSELLMRDGFLAGSKLHQDRIAILVSILSADEGRNKWDNFLERKRAGRPVKSKLQEKRSKRENSVKVFKRLADPLATEENISEFMVEYDRISKEQSTVVSPVLPSKGPEVSL